jgi:hypothetical protein
MFAKNRKNHKFFVYFTDINNTGKLRFTLIKYRLHALHGTISTIEASTSIKEFYKLLQPTILIEKVVFELRFLTITMHRAKFT